MVLYRPQEERRYIYYLEDHPEVFWVYFSGSEAAAVLQAQMCIRDREYKSLVHRLNRIEGQIRGIRGMVENEVYCPDILVQLSLIHI